MLIRSSLFLLYIFTFFYIFSYHVIIFIFRWTFHLSLIFRTWHVNASRTIRRHIVTQISYHAITPRLLCTTREWRLKPSVDQTNTICGPRTQSVIALNILYINNNPNNVIIRSKNSLILWEISQNIIISLDLTSNLFIFFTLW